MYSMLVLMRRSPRHSSLPVELLAAPDAGFNGVCDGPRGSVWWNDDHLIAAWAGVDEG